MDALLRRNAESIRRISTENGARAETSSRTAYRS